MDVLEFVAHSEWPIVVGVSIWLLRRPFEKMLDRVSPTKVDAFGFKAEFERTLDKVEQLTTVGDQKPTKRRTTERDLIEIKGLITASPEAIILDSWNQLQNRVEEIVPSKRAGKRILIVAGGADLQRELNLSDDEVAAFDSLRKLRNQVAHSEAPVSRGRSDEVQRGH